MSKHLVIPDPHAHPKYHNRRAEWLGRLIVDTKPDVVVHIGDGADMPSLSDYDRGKRSFQGRTYRADVDADLDFNDRLWSIVKKAKKRLPKRYRLEGNHEHRIVRAIESQPELDGAIGLQDLEIERYYDVWVPYVGTTPGTVEIDGIHYAHFHISGVMGRAISGEHPAYSLGQKNGLSSTAGHLHLLDYCIRTNVNGTKRHCLVAGVFQDYQSDWAGNSQKLWWSGVVLKHNVYKGAYDPEFISIERLKAEYGR